MPATTTTTTTSETPALAAWVQLLRGHAATVKAMNAALVRAHRLTINDYETLLLLSRAEGGRLRRTDLARDLRLSAGGVTRLLDGLEAAGLVEKDACSSDGRVSYAVLTEKGRGKLEAASRSHVAAIDLVFAERYTRDELDTLAELLGRLPTRGVRCPLGD